MEQEDPPSGAGELPLSCPPPCAAAAVSRRPAPSPCELRRQSRSAICVHASKQASAGSAPGRRLGAEEANCAALPRYAALNSLGREGGREAAGAGGCSEGGSPRTETLTP